MTTPTMAREPWWRFFGPWPLQPLPVAGIVGLFTVGLGLKNAPWIEQGPAILSGAAVTLVGWLILASARRWASGIVALRSGYIAVFVVTSLSASTIRLIGGVLPGNPDLRISFTSAAIMSVLALIVIQGILGSAQDRLRRGNARATEAAAALQQQQMALLKADEAVRQQVAIVLHDQVQAGLVSACLRLQTARSADESVEEQQRAIGEVIRQLEQLRSLDLRRAVRSLSPNLRDVDMQTSLEELADTWSPSMKVEVSIVGQVPKDRDLRLGAYRIVEQALLNAASHGKATRCGVEINVTDLLIVRVGDDGSGMSSEAVPGLGSTLLDTWCRTLKGDWRWEESPLGGVCLRADLPLREVTEPRSTVGA
ncbi:MAG: hypothetical protein NWR60_03420 [Candidatus Nanopelagicales bacterium]|jgi:signal transduction histidine kinase|nr:hypothetical protein [Candidatus Nanopelagicales bacterium]MDP4824885.1 hypothetical protein [Candidatus Nanopelagicales bacterium]MDP4887417.1 hypothetical protein [Candidatus Nanopelagicales bacterium]